MKRAAIRWAAMRRLLLFVLAAVLLPAPAQAYISAELRAADGSLIASAGEGAFAHPGGGGALRIGAAAHANDRAVLSGVVLLGGRVTAERLVIPARGVRGARIDGLRVDGKAVAGRANALRMLGDGGYVVALQQAIAPGRVGLVGLRVHLARAYAGLPAGAEILVGLPPSAAPAGTRQTGSLLGFRLGGVRAPGSLPGGPGFVYPLTVRGPIIGCPFAIGSTHSPLAWPHNLASDNAVDLAAPVGTPVLAVEDGVIGDRFGSLGSDDPRMAGLRLHLFAIGRRYYYTHLSRLDVVPGQRVVAGQQIGLSGSAGAAHLHFAQDAGNPAQTIGRAAECGVYRPFVESYG